MDTEMKERNQKGRPNYTMAFKRRLAAAACESGVSVSKLALANAINTNMLFRWRREYQAGLFDGTAKENGDLLPVVIDAAPNAAVLAETAPVPTSTPSTIEIVIADAVVRIHGHVEARVLRTIVQSLRS